MARRIIACLLAGAAFGNSIAFAGDDANKSIDSRDWLDYVSEDFSTAIVVHPSRLTKDELIKPFSLDSLIVNQVGALSGSTKLAESLRPENIRRVVVFAQPLPGGNVMFFPAAIVEFNSDVDAKAILAEAWEGAESIEFHGKTYSLSKSMQLAGAPIAAFIHDKRTILFGPETTLRSMLDASKDSPLKAQLRKADLDHDVTIEHSGAALAARMTKILNVPIERFYDDEKAEPWMRVALRDLETLSIHIDASGENVLSARIVTPDQEGVERMSKQLSEWRDLLKGQVAPLANAVLPEPLGRPLGAAGVQILDDVSIAATGLSVSVVLPKSKGWSALNQALSGMRQPMADE
jgi:hypothetical protein